MVGLQSSLVPKLCFTNSKITFVVLLDQSYAQMYMAVNTKWWIQSDNHLHSLYAKFFFSVSNSLSKFNSLKGSLLSVQLQPLDFSFSIKLSFKHFRHFLTIWDNYFLDIIHTNPRYQNEMSISRFQKLQLRLEWRDNESWLHSKLFLLQPFFYKILLGN